MAQEQQDRGLFGLFGEKKHHEQQQQQQYGGAAAAAGYPATHTHTHGHKAQAIPSSEGDLHSSGYGYGGNSHESDAGNYGTTTGVGHASHTPAGFGHNGAGAPQAAASQYAADERKHGKLGNLIKNDNSSSSSSSEDEDGESSEKGHAKKGGIKEKLKKILPGHKNE